MCWIRAWTDMDLGAASCGIFDRTFSEGLETNHRFPNLKARSQLLTLLPWSRLHWQCDWQRGSDVCHVQIHVGHIHHSETQKHALKFWDQPCFKGYTHNIQSSEIASPIWVWKRSKSCRWSDTEFRHNWGQELYDWLNLCQYTVVCACPFVCSTAWNC